MLIENFYEYKLKKGSITAVKDVNVSIFFMILDSINLPIDEIAKNYNINIAEKLYKDLKELGYD